MSALASRAALAVAASLVVLAGAPGAARAAAPAIEDDYPGALARAKELGVPLVVDVWAPW